MKSKLEETNTVLTNFKMYKSGKQWLFASVAAVAMLAATGAATTVHADTTTPAQPQTTQQTSQSQPATKENTTTLSTSNASQGNGGNVSGNSLSAELYSSNGGSNQTVQTYPHKDQIDNAVKSVQNTPHLTVHQDPDQVVTGNSQEEIDQKIQNDYNQQVQDLKKQKDQAILSNQEHANYKKYNETHGDTSALDQTVKDANNTPGLTVVKDNDTNSNFSSDDTNGLRNWVTNTQTDYQHQVEQMKQAIAAQKQNNADFDQKKAEYQSALDKYQSLLSSVDTLNPTDIIQGLHLSGTAGKTTETVLQPDDGTAINGIAHWYSHNMNGVFLEVHYSDITGAYYTDMNGATHPIKSVNITYSNLIIGKLKDGRYAYFEPAQGGAWAGVDSFYIKSVDATYEFYDENNQKINFDPGTAWFFLSSLTRWPSNNDGNAQADPAQDHVEAVQALNGSKLYNIPGGKAKVHANGNAYADPTDAIQHREP